MSGRMFLCSLTIPWCSTMVSIFFRSFITNRNSNHIWARPSVDGIVYYHIYQQSAYQLMHFSATICRSLQSIISNLFETIEKNEIRKQKHCATAIGIGNWNYSIGIVQWSKLCHRYSMNIGMIWFCKQWPNSYLITSLFLLMFQFIIENALEQRKNQRISFELEYPSMAV